MDAQQVFWCEPSGVVRRYLRCYVSRSGHQLGVPEVKDEQTDPCSGYCNAMVLLDEIPEEWDEHENGQKYRRNYPAADFPWDAFPTVCSKCGRPMDNPTRQVFCDEILVAKTGPRAGERFCRRELPTGAMFDIPYYHDIPEWCGRDGLAVMVRTPDGEWHCDGMANNCTRREDKTHRCWVRHGDPRTGYLHVDKNGTPEQPTCEAGAGSIWMRAPTGWHGFLHRGYLVDADRRGEVDAMLDAARPRPLPVAERVLKQHVIDQLRRVFVAAPVVRTGWRSNRGFQVRPKR